MKKLIVSGALVTAALLVGVALLIGFFAPNGALDATDEQLSGQTWAMTDAPRAYTYEGTLENRARALDVWQDGAPDIRRAETDSYNEGNAANAWSTLFDAGLLPTRGDGADARVRAFTLTHREVSANYRYLDVEARGNGETLRAILDEETGAFLWIEFLCAPTIMSEWTQDASEDFYTAYKWDELIKAFAAFSGYGEVRDIGNNFAGSEAVKGYEVDVKGTHMALSVKYAPKQGLLMYRQFTRPLT